MSSMTPRWLRVVYWLNGAAIESLMPGEQEISFINGYLDNREVCRLVLTNRRLLSVVLRGRVNIPRMTWAERTRSIWLEEITQVGQPESGGRIRGRLGMDRVLLTLANEGPVYLYARNIETTRETLVEAIAMSRARPRTW